MSEKATNASAKSRNPFPTQIQHILHHVHVIWLFTVNDLKSIVLPETVFGICVALAGPLLTTNTAPSLRDILLRLPLVITWNWLNVLLFDVANQRLPGSILEDSVNKAWRPLPSRLVTEVHARRILLAVIPIVFLASLVLGGMQETVMMMVLTWMYNDLGGADESFHIRNFINALGFMCYSSGAGIVSAGSGSFELNVRAYQWIAIIGGIVFTTLSLQDMPDIPGDAARGRRTLPLVYGETAARYLIALPIIFWSGFCPKFWDLGIASYAVVLGLGGYIAIRLLVFRGVAADKVSWKLWCLWTSIIYMLPVFKNHDSLVQFWMSLHWNQSSI